MGYAAKVREHLPVINPTARAYALYYETVNHKHRFRCYENIFVGYTWSEDRARRWGQLIGCIYEETFLSREYWPEVD